MAEDARMMPDMSEDSETLVRCEYMAVSHFLLTVVIDSLTDEARLESAWTMMLTNEIVISSESME